MGVMPLMSWYPVSPMSPPQPARMAARLASSKQCLSCQLPGNAVLQASRCPCASQMVWTLTP
jgi:hypothetical protein